MRVMTCLIPISLTCICPEISSPCYAALGPAASIAVIVIITDTCRGRTTTAKEVRKENFKGLSFVLRKQQPKAAVCFFLPRLAAFMQLQKSLLSRGCGWWRCPRPRAIVLRSCGRCGQSSLDADVPQRQKKFTA